MNSSEANPASRGSIVPLLLVGLLILAAVAGVWVWKYLLSGAGEQAVTSAASLAPDFDLPALDGTRHTSRDYEGKIVLLEFWATWCGPCRLQARILDELYADVRGPGLEFLAISLGETPEVVERFGAKAPFPYPVLIDRDELLGAELEIFALPTVAIVDGAGRLTYLRPGVSDASTLKRALSEARLSSGQTAASSS